LLEDGKDISDMSVTKTHKLIEQILLPKQVFRNTVYFSQQVKDFFTSLNDAEQKKIFNAIMGLDEWRSYYVEADTRIKDKQKELSDITTKVHTLTELVDEKNRFVQGLHNDKKIVEANINDQIKKEKELLKTLSIKESDLLRDKTTLKFDEDEYVKLKTNLSKLKEKLEDCKKYVQLRKKEVESEQISLFEKMDLIVKTKVSEAKDKFETEYFTQKSLLDNELKQIEQDINDIKLTSIENELIKTKTKSISDLTIKEQETKHLFEILKGKAENIKVQYDEVLNQVKHDEEEITKLDEGKSICFYCEQEIGKENNSKVKSKLEERITLNNATLNDLRKTFNQIKEDASKEKNNLLIIQKQIEDITREYDQKIADEKLRCKNIIENKEKKKNELEETLLEIRNECMNNVQKVRTELSKESGARRTEQMKKDRLVIEEAEKSSAQEEKEITSAIEEITSTISESDSVRNKLESLEQMIKDVQIDIASRSSTLKQLESFKYDDNKIEVEKQKLESCIKDLDSNLSESNSIKSMISILDFWKEGFSDRGIKSMLIDSSIPFLNKKIKEELTKVAPGKFIVSFDTISQTKAGDVRDKISVNVLNVESGANSHSQLSGGEKRLIDVCTLLSLRSLTEHLYGKRINLLLLDEVLDSLDTNNSTIYCRVLKQLAESMSIYLITHELKVNMECDEVYRL
jgi:DNA repair exonuclease SbcCD ATPase subunit